MSASQYFAGNYAQAREKFLEATGKHRAAVESFENPNKGPNAETLTTDVAWHGPRDAKRVLMTMSGTHGAEGFCGSGVQVGWLESGLIEEMPEDVALLQVHAINPHGFAWIRRVTEDNVDLNRNFVAHGVDPYPENPGYDELAEAICPREWDDATLAAADKVLRAYAEEHGLMGLQTAISGGQYKHPDGIFYGGNAETWSNHTLMAILERYLGKAEKVAVIDYHTGLGPRGYGERICVHDPESAGYRRAMDWYDEDITSPFTGSSSSAPLHGVNLMGMERALSNAEMTGIALEYGTRPFEAVKYALRADNWLHIHGDLESRKGKEIKAEIRSAFYQDADDWKEMIWERAVDTQRRAIRGLIG